VNNKTKYKGIIMDGQVTSQSISPTPPQTKSGELDFLEALTQVMTGKSITKLEWGNRNIFGVLRDTHLMLHKGDNRYYDWIITDGDLYGKDYIIL
jgi:hypothetical protein